MILSLVVHLGVAIVATVLFLAALFAIADRRAAALYRELDERGVIERRR